VKTFSCHCGNTLYFENSICMVCGRTTGFVAETLSMGGMDQDGGDLWCDPDNGARYRKCRNYRTYDVCNWMVPVDDPEPFCRSCRLNLVIPDLDVPRNLTLWYRVEVAKRRLLYTLFELRLPVTDRRHDPDRGLGFEFLADAEDSEEFANDLLPHTSVITGHRAGIITINIREAEDSAREEMRVRMNERYRTLLGHFRHEIGHYYWDRLVAHNSGLDRFRELFGDERGDYARSLEMYYRDGPPVGWEESWISAYASAHPWEDWAETWAHYLHMVDTLETAHDYGFSIEGRRLAALHAAGQAAPGYDPASSFDRLIADWGALTVALNALNRSMGLPDAYPFALSGKTLDKLAFVHQLINR
jgi:hypothetical protein